MIAKLQFIHSMVFLSIFESQLVVMQFYQKFLFSSGTGKCIILLIFYCLVNHACKPIDKGNEFVLRIRIPDEPDCLHPVVSQSGIATQIEQLIMPPLFEYSLDKLEFSPLLIDSLTNPESVNDSTISYTYHIHASTSWDDGIPLTADDIIYTIKSSLNPLIKNKTYAGFFKNIRDVKVMGSDHKTIRFEINKNYMLGLEMSGNYCIYPEHIYDPNHIMSQFSLQDLLTLDSASWGEGQWSSLKNYAELYQSQAYCKEKIVGCGPYKIASWQSGQKITLEKKKNWWGDSLISKYPLLSCYPDRIEYWILPEEATAVLELQNNHIDLASDLSPQVFENLREKEKQHLNFATPTLMQYMYIEFNHRNLALQIKSVRQAMSQLFNTDQFIKDQFNGLAIRANSPVHPSKSFYNKDITAYPYNPSAAIQLLKSDNWMDSNNDGSLDKLINGKKIELNFRFYITNKELSKKIGLLFQEECKKAGIKIDLIPKESVAFLKDLNELNFDLALMAQRQQPSLWDPYQSFHSSNAKPGGFNKSGYANPTADSLIMHIRNTSSNIDRTHSYLELQKLLHDDVVQLFLFIPKERIAYNNRLIIETGSRRPGYYEGLINRR